MSLPKPGHVFKLSWAEFDITSHGPKPLRLNEQGEVVHSLDGNWKEELNQLGYEKRQEVYEWLYDLGHRIRR